MEKTIALIPGDGIGPDVVAEAVNVLDDEQITGFKPFEQSMVRRTFKVLSRLIITIDVVLRYVIGFDRHELSVGVLFLGRDPNIGISFHFLSSCI